MENKQIKLPQLKVIVKGSNRARFLERLAENSGGPQAELTFQKDNTDLRIITIKYIVPGKEKDNSILYYSEAFNKHTIITSNLELNYDGRVVVKDFNDCKLGISLQNLSLEECLRKSHIDRINQIQGIRRDLTLEYAAKRYESLVYSLPEFSGK